MRCGLITILFSLVTGACVHLPGGQPAVTGLPLCAPAIASPIENDVKYSMVNLAGTIFERRSAPPNYSARRLSRGDLALSVDKGSLEAYLKQQNPARDDQDGSEENLTVGVEHQTELRLPDEINPHVRKWLAYFQGEGRGHMTRYLERSKRYLSLMKSILRDHGVPEDLVYVALIESGFRSFARSPKQAEGYWQFIKGTAKRYGLAVNALVDERRDPVLSTIAAAKYLKGLYKVFDSWHLALASYNAGENKIKYLVMRHFTRDFWYMVEKDYLPYETANYVPKFIAARMIANSPEVYGFNDIKGKKPIEFDQIWTKRPVFLNKIAKQLAIPYSQMQDLNPGYKSRVAVVIKGYGARIRVPKGMQDAAENAIRSSYAQDQRYVVVGQKRGYNYHRVRSGDSLSEIAGRYATTIGQLKALNRLRKNMIFVGQRIKIPHRR